MLALFVGCAILCLTVVSAGARVVVSLRRRNRINPRIRTHAPLAWLWQTSGCARAHRRLRRALRGAHGAVAQGAVSGIPVDGLVDCVGELERLALSVDDQLVVAARFATSIRRSMLRGLRPEVTEIEMLAARIAATVVSRSHLSEERLADSVARITERLDALDAAHAELARLEAAWQRPVPLAAPTETAPVRRSASG